MDWTHYGLAVLAAVVAVSFTDWFFMGILFHEKYKAYPEIWRRPQGGPGETRAILISTLFTVLTCAVFIYTCGRLRLIRSGAEIRAGGRAMGPLPLLLTNLFWIKMHLLMGLSHGLGWLARLAVSALATSALLR